MSQTENDDLTSTIERHNSAAEEEKKARLELYETLGTELEFAEHGRRAEIARLTGLSRETLRRLGKTYYRSVIRWDGPRAMIKQPSDALHPGSVYEIRDTDRETVLAKVKGQDIIDLRRRQLVEYLSENPDRTNISMVDISSLLPICAPAPE